MEPQTNPNRTIRKRGDDECFTTQSLAEESLKRGARYTFRETVTLADGETREYVIDNSLSEDSLRVVTVLIDPDGRLSGVSDADVDGVGTGTDLAFRSDCISEGFDTKPDGITVEVGGTYSGGRAPLDFEARGGVGEGATKTQLKALPTSNARICPGFNLRYEITSEEPDNGLTFETILARH